MLSVLFKQKTAYEMRISDWSSDVCSSDLEDVMINRPDDLYPVVLQPLHRLFERLGVLHLKRKVLNPGRRVGIEVHRLGFRQGIGRASYLERVIKYVSI